ncbi:MAG: hypothetical protein JWO94_2272 [Verrucomicrobiaceae bacterium]|nr:hypothetical protein [Verrucomicrobiaceae bacterium]
MWPCRSCFPQLLCGLCLLGGLGRLRADPTDEQQYWLELINQARRDPAGELARLVNYDTPTTFASPASNDTDIAAALSFFGVSASDLAGQWSTLTAAPPLAWNNNLADSAASYSQVMVTMDQQAHNLGGLTLDQRTTNAGYSANYADLGENLYAAAKGVNYAHAGFLIDWGDSDSNPNNGFGNGLQADLGHRTITFDPVFKEVGIGIVKSGIPAGNVAAVGPYVVTQHFGNQFHVVNGRYVFDAILTGVVYADNVLANHFYTPGEGIGGAAVQVFDDVTNQLLFAGATNSAGGYNIDLAGVTDGEQLRIELPGFGVDRQYVTITTDPSVYAGDPVTFYNNVYAGFIVAPEPGGMAALVLSGLILGCRRRRFCFDKGA